LEVGIGTYDDHVEHAAAGIRDRDFLRCRGIGRDRPEIDHVACDVNARSHVDSFG
jgi:hypothetical protein